MRTGQARRNRVLARLFLLGVGALIAATLAPHNATAADQETLLHSFCNRVACDGDLPVAGLIRNASGKLYGTTPCNGAYGGGTVFELTPPAKGKTAWRHKALYNFCAPEGASCSDGENPEAGLIMDASHNLYGTTSKGGMYGGGTVFELTGNADNTGWTETVLYSFCTKSDCADGAAPVAGLIMDKKTGKLYGTTSEGGAYTFADGGLGGGTAFELTPPAKGKTKWTEKVLYNFCALGGAGCSDGAVPAAGLIRDASGHLYGTTERGGAADDFAYGTVFELTPPAKGETIWTENVLWSFCAQVTNDICTDGDFPVAGLVMDRSGNLYGTTANGGAADDYNQGTVFELTPPATGETAWTETVVYSFCAEIIRGLCADGADPEAGLIMDTSGNLYGTTKSGGRGGTAFELTPNAAKAAWTHKVLYYFCVHSGKFCSDGAEPEAGLVRDPSGNLYGTTYFGGEARNRGGTSFELTP
jgi:uncharacterized repeat protein (TIGR03803 family)